MRMRIYCQGCGKRIYTDEKHSLEGCKNYLKLEFENRTSKVKEG